MRRGLMITQLSALIGFTVKTIRHYHRLGLIVSPCRDRSGYRRYAQPICYGLSKSAPSPKPAYRWPRSVPSSTPIPTGSQGSIDMITTRAGERDELVDVVVTGTKDMPGCLNHVVALG